MFAGEGGPQGTKLETINTVTIKPPTFLESNVEAQFIIDPSLSAQLIKVHANGTHVISRVYIQNITDAYTQTLMVGKERHVDTAVVSAGGGGGRVQHVMFVLSAYSFAIVNLQTYMQMFSQGDDQYRCQVPFCDNGTSTYNEYWLNFTTPKEHDTKTGTEVWSRCKFYLANTTQNYCTSVDFNRSSEVKCSEYIFESQYGTLKEKWGLVCGKKDFLSLGMSIYMAGLLCGVFTFGVLSDRFGRRVAVHSSIALLVSCSTANIFAQNFYMFIVLRFFIAMGTIGLANSAFVLLSEICGVKNRSVVIIATFGSEVGLFLMIGLAYQYRGFVDLQIAVTVCCSLSLIFFAILPESPRWMISKEKFDDASNLFLKMARWNKKNISENELKEILEKELYAEFLKSNTTKLGFLFILKNRETCKRFVIIAWIWICDSLVGYGLGLGTKNMSGNLFINFSMIAFGCTIGCVIGILSTKYIRRRLALVLFFLTLGILCLINAFLPSEYKTASIILAMFSTCFINAAFNITYIYTVELFPTPVRSTAMGTSSMFSRVGGILAPFVVESINVWRPFPFIIFAATSIISSFGVLFLSETFGKPLPSSLDDITTRRKVSHTS